MTAMTLCELKKFIDKKKPSTLLLDVRSPAEHRARKIENSRNIPLGELPSRLEELSKYKTIIVYCNRGVRSEKASRILEEFGIETVYHVTGSSEDWESAGLPVIMMA